MNIEINILKTAYKKIIEKNPDLSKEQIEACLLQFLKLTREETQLQNDKDLINLIICVYQTPEQIIKLEEQYNEELSQLKIRN